ncbi:MAG: molybdopterin synthase sulfur carrier subunit [Thiotrichales bacterium]|nr:molybdopterin synthase sulfur carrier subunit [Thiotrichales bacterium]
MIEARLSGPYRQAADGASSVVLDARTIRQLFVELVELYPGLREHVDQGIAVSINGQIFRDTWGQEIPADAEVFLLPRIPGG